MKMFLTMKLKNLLILSFAVLTLFSCGLDDDGTDFYYEFTPIESVIVPDEFLPGHTYTIAYSYLHPTTCHVFNNLYYSIEESTRTVAVINLVFEDSNCEIQDNVLLERSFEFIVTQSSGTSYTFKFWQGEDENGDPIYLIHEIPVN